MKRLFFFSLLLSVSLFSERLLIHHQRSINVKYSVDRTSKIIGVAYAGDVYSVINKKTGYYLVKLPDGRSGWVQMEGSYRRMEEDGDTLTILDSIVSVYDELSATAKPVSSVQAGDKLPILKREYTHYKIRLYDGIEGWVYAGKPDSPWVTLLAGEKEESTQENNYVVDFSVSTLENNVKDIKIHRGNFLNSRSCHQFFEEKESSVSIQFNLTYPVPKYLELTQAIKSIEGMTPDHATIISVTLNDVPIISGLRIGGEPFFPSYIFIPSGFVKGVNTLVIAVESLSSPYLLQKMRLFDAELVEELKRFQVE